MANTIYNPTENKPIKVLIVDDSTIVRNTLKEILSEDDNLEVIGTAQDPFVAADIIKKRVPDVITLDIEMPRMNGLTFLKKIMSQYPIPIVIISSLADEGSDAALKAMEYGAVDVVSKPKLGSQRFLKESKIRLIDKIIGASQAKLKKINSMKKISSEMIATTKKKYSNSKSIISLTNKVIVVGASTGGTEAVRIFLQQMPMIVPGIVIVQHMPELFTRNFAERLNTICDINVSEAKNGDRVLKGHALIAPGNKHTLLKIRGANYHVEVKDGPLVNRHRPSADVLFKSTARYAGKNAVGVILTGMGGDGAKGILELKQSGAFTIAQNQETCVVFGMPKEAIKLGGIDDVLPLTEIAPTIIKKFGTSHFY